jgi:diaminopimelate epimerase
VRLPGGELRIRWEGAGHPVWMTGEAITVFEGTVEA